MGEGVFNEYFSSLFRSSNPTREAIDLGLKDMDPRVTNQIIDDLQKAFTKAEVEYALKQMAPLKSPGPDGYAVCFYKAY